jgi:type VI protein secretion system component Hcp
VELLEDRAVPTAATHLVFGQQPTDTIVGQVFARPVTVLAEDALGHVDTSFNQTVSIALLANPAGARLSGTTRVIAHSGVATFADLSLDRPSDGLTLVATAGALSTLSPKIGLDIAGDESAGEIAVDSFQWGDANPAVSGPGGPVGRASFEAFQLTLNPGTADPGMWAAVADGRNLPTVVLHVRASAGASDYQTYTFSDVTFTGYHTDNGKVQVTLSMGAVQESERPIKSDGSLGSPVTFRWDIATSTGSGARPQDVAPTATKPALGLSFGAGTSEFAVQSYSWGDRSAGVGRPTFDDMQLVLQPGVLDPALWGAVAADQLLPQAVLHVRTAAGGAEYLTDTLSDVTVTSYHTDNGLVTVWLHFGQVQETNRPIKPDGSLGSPVSFQWNVTTNTGSGVRPQDVTAPSARPAIGLSLGTDGGTGEFAVQSYAWGDRSAGRPVFDDLQLVLRPGALDPALWGAVATGQLLPQAVLHVRTAAGGAEFLTYTLSDVSLSSYHTDNGLVTVQLHFGQVQESDRPIKPDGSLGSPVKFQWDVTTSTGSGARPQDVTPTATKPAIGLSLGAGTQEFAVQSYSWGDRNAGGQPVFDDLQLVLRPGALDPALWGAVATGQHLPQAVLHVRSGAGGAEFLTDTLSDVTFTSYHTDNGLVTVRLHFGQVQETDRPIKPDGSLGSPASFQWNLATNTGSGVRPQDVTAPSAKPAIGLSLGTDGGTGEFAVQSYAWGDRSAGGRPEFDDLQLVLRPGALDPALWGAVATGQHLPEAVLHVRTATGGTEYLTDSLSDVTVTDYRTDNGLVTVRLHFGQVQESDRPIKPDGSLGSPLTFKWDVTTNTGSGVRPQDVTPTATKPALGLSFRTGTSEFAVRSYSWGDRSAGGAGRPTFDDLNLVLQPGALDPALWGAVATGQHLPQVVLHVRTSAGGAEYRTYTLSDVTVTSYHNDDGTVTISLRFARFQEDDRPVFADGTVGAAIEANWDLNRNTGQGAIVPTVFRVVSSPFRVR